MLEESRVKFDLAMTDELLATTRAVRKRLDLDRPVPRQVIEECLELALQAPTGGNSQGWRWVVVDDAKTRKALADLYRAGAEGYLAAAGQRAREAGNKQTERVFDSATYLVDVLHRVPVHVIPCIEGRPPAGTPVTLLSGLFGSIYPAVWSFQLALRARGLGSALTTLHLLKEKEAADLLGIPEHVMQVALLPVAYTKGSDFKRADRPPAATVTHWNHW
jgi:nitroreductase